MNYKFRNDLLESNKEFNLLFNKLMNEGKISNFDDVIWNIIEKDKTPIRMGKDVFVFKDLFLKDLTSGRCKTCTYELVMLLDHLGYDVKAVYCYNKYFKGTIGSKNGGHWYVEASIDDKLYEIDTSLMIISNGYFKKFGYKFAEKFSIRDLFIRNEDLMKYYDLMEVEWGYEL